MAFPRDLQLALRRLLGDEPVRIDELAAADHRLGLFIAEACTAWLKELNIERTRISAIGSHGQTLRHLPPSSHTATPSTVQIGDPNLIAERTGITTVADFRRRDIAAGGEGAPLAPLFHAAVLADERERRWILNLGGIANLTRLFPGKPLLGFDTGPANALLDAWIQQQRGEDYDAAGRWAATGTIVEPLLEAWLADPYFALPTPKSTGKEQFNLNWIVEQSQVAELAPEDLQRTLLELTAVTVADAMKRIEPASDRLLLCGGGRHNTLLVDRLAALTAVPVTPTDAYGIDGDALEAGLFGWLAHCAIDGISSPIQSVTGARGDRILGAVYPA